MRNIKKIMIHLVILLVVFSTQAFAFATGDLILSVYNNTATTPEIGIDLGSLSSLNLNNTVAVTLGNINLSALGTSSWSDLNAGIFAYTSTASSTTAYFATTTNGTPSIKTGSLTSFTNDANLVTNYYQTQSGGTSTTPALATTNHNTYYYTMDTHGTVEGAYGGYNKDIADNPEANLANGDSGTSTTLYLYEFLSNTAVAGANGNPYVAMIDIMSNGNIVLDANASTVPIPAAFLLFGSGLLGLIGLKRKQIAA
jgi:hypothetical protein